MERTSKKLPVAHYVRVSVKEPDDQAATPAMDLDKLLREDTVDGLYIPTQERFFRNPPDDDPSLAEFVLRDWLRQKAKMSKK